MNKMNPMQRYSYLDSRITIDDLMDVIEDFLHFFCYIQIFLIYVILGYFRIILGYLFPFYSWRFFHKLNSKNNLHHSTQEEYPILLNSSLRILPEKDKIKISGKRCQSIGCKYGIITWKNVKLVDLTKCELCLDIEEYGMNRRCNHCYGRCEHYPIYQGGLCLTCWKISSKCWNSSKNPEEFHKMFQLVYRNKCINLILNRVI